MTTCLTLVRHATPAIDPAAPAALWNLSPAGRAGARALASELAATGIERVVTSVEAKAHQTGAILAAAAGVPIVTRPGLHEHERATAPFFASEDEFRRAVIDAMRRPDDLVLGEETATAARIRFTAAVRGAIAEFAGEHLAVVSHGTVIALLVAHASGGDPVDLWRQQRMPWAIRVGLPGLVPMVD